MIQNVPLGKSVSRENVFQATVPKGVAVPPTVVNVIQTMMFVQNVKTDIIYLEENVLTVPPMPHAQIVRAIHLLVKKTLSNKETVAFVRLDLN